MQEIVILGAEGQAATSIATAYPERQFVFATDCPVVDGWDLPNVRIVHSKAAWAAEERDASRVVPLSAQWLPRPAAAALSCLFPAIARSVPEAVIALLPRPVRDAPSIAKGDLWHRPDHPVSGSPVELTDLVDPHGCGLVYQPLLSARATVMAIGRRNSAGNVAMGLFHVLAERFFRIDVIQAAETVAMPELVELSTAVLATVNLKGWFTLNWVLTKSGPRLSSLRPVPRAVFGCFRRSGVDLLGAFDKDVILPPGLRMIGTPTYTEFQWPNW
jgi:hypothetical protein